MLRKQETLGLHSAEHHQGKRKLLSVMMAAALLSGCAPTSETPPPTVEVVKLSLEEELAQKLEQNRLNTEGLKIDVADYENLPAAADAWFDTFIDNCVKHGNPRLSYENNLEFVGTSSATDINEKVYTQFRLQENLDVCKEALMTDTLESTVYAESGLKDINTIFIVNQLYDNSPSFERGELTVEFSSESLFEGYVPFTISRIQQGTEESETENFGFKFTVSEDGTLLWSKRGT